MWHKNRLKFKRILVIIGFLSKKPDDVRMTVLVKANHGKSPDIRNILKLERFEEPANLEPIIPVKIIK